MDDRLNIEYRRLNKKQMINFDVVHSWTVFRVTDRSKVKMDDSTVNWK